VSNPKILEWHNCYDESNKPFITKDSFSHPAKGSVALFRKIFNFLEEIGAIKKDDLIVDCFGGIAMTGLIGSTMGYRVITVELEDKFVKLGNDNIKRITPSLVATNKTVPVHIQGDSRFLSKILAEKCSSIVTSPPYFGTLTGGGINKKGYKSKNGKIDPMGKRNYTPDKFSPDNISNAPEGNIDSIISSPPYEGISTGQGGLNTKPPKNGKGQTGRNPNLASQNADTRYGTAKGQISRLKGGDVDSIISSPPWEDNTEGMISKKKFKDPAKFAENASTKSGGGRNSASKEAIMRQLEKGDKQEGYGETEGQIGKLKGGDVEAIVTSPPYADSELTGERNFKGSHNANDNRASKNKKERYGEGNGQISNLKEGKIDSIVTSPPYEDSVNSEKHGIDFSKAKKDYPGRVMHEARIKDVSERHARMSYGKEDGQIGALKKETYWEACAKVYEQCHLILKPGGHAALVVKNFVRKGQVIDLAGNTCKLLEHLGFTIEYRIHAMLIKDMGTADMFTGKTKTSQRKSFFKRLHEQKHPETKIDWEEVIIARKT